MEESAQAHNDKLMKTAYQILEQCKEESIPIMLWGGGAIYHIIGGELNYRKMSDLEFFYPKKVDKQINIILGDMGFYANRPFNNMQNMSRTPRREFYRPDRELTIKEIEDVEHGRKANVEDVEFEKVELFVTGIRMCWTFKFDDLPNSFNETLICPPGFQLALKANAIHQDDFDLKDIQDIACVLNSNCCEKVSSKDTIFTDAFLDKDTRCIIGTEIFEYLSNAKQDFSKTVLRNLNEVLKYSGLNESGKNKLLKLIDFIRPLEEKDKNSSFMSKIRKEKPVRVESRYIGAGD
ncbi:MAG: hypothetical protein ACXAEU_09140 [Candidatus Hodarchaeales archaeon]|jgi:hypothetical protein